ncbi:MAG: hypothetical protein V6Z82_02460 [Flavobacteriales bacterium]
MTVKEYLFVGEFLKANSSKIYIESGSGGSTVMANKYFGDLYSYETDPRFVAYLNDLTGKKIVELINVGEVEKFGYPIVQSIENAKKISACLLGALNERRDRSAIIFIDGRCRVLTALNCAAYLNSRDIVMIHDFERKFYHEVLYFFDIIKLVDTIVVLKIKENLDLKLLEREKEHFKLDFR